LPCGQFDKEHDDAGLPPHRSTERNRDRARIGAPQRARSRGRPNRLLYPETGTRIGRPFFPGIVRSLNSAATIPLLTDRMGSMKIMLPRTNSVSPAKTGFARRPIKTRSILGNFARNTSGDPDRDARPPCWAPECHASHDLQKLWLPMPLRRWQLPLHVLLRRGLCSVFTDYEEYPTRSGRRAGQ
jgi:hypothetical protein